MIKTKTDNMHYLTYIGLIIIAIGTALTIIGQNIQSDDNNSELISTINAKDEKINSLSTEVKLLRENDDIKDQKRKEKIKTIALRAGKIFSEGNLFYATFLSRHNNEVYKKLMKDNFQKNELPDDEIVKDVKSVFLTAKMLEPSHVLFKADKTPFSELDFFHIQMTKIYSETNTILQHYGDVDHVIIEQLDNLRGRSKMLVESLPSLKSVQGGINGLFKDGVPDQWADFFSYYYLVQHQCEIECNKVLSEKD